MKHLVLYVPGLGDHYDKGRSLALKGWRLWGIEARLVPMKWYETGAYQDKILLVRNAVNDALKKGYAVTLVGESAGASLVLNAAATLPELHRIIVIAGVNSSRLPISSRYKVSAPAFFESAQRVSDSLETFDRTKIHTIHALVDSVVSPRFNDIQNAKNHTLWTIGHIATIILCTTIFSGFIARLVRQK